MHGVSGVLGFFWLSFALCGLREQVCLGWVWRSHGRETKAAFIL